MGGTQSVGTICKAQYAAEDVLSNLKGGERFPSNTIINTYYQGFYGRCGSGDQRSICEMLWNDDNEWEFENASHKFKLIDDSGIYDVYVLYGVEGKELIQEIINTHRIDRNKRRRLQRYRVGLRKGVFKMLLEGGILERVGLWNDPNQAIYIMSDTDSYSEEVGVKYDNHWLTDTLIK